MKTVSVVINARLHSSRLSRKLLRPFAGTTLIEIALEKINRMSFFDHRYLAVAEEELKRLAAAYPNVDLLGRSMEAVKPGYGDHKVIYEHYAWIDSDYIFWLNPCHPLLTIETVKKALDVFHETNCNSYTAVVPAREWLFDKDGNPVTNTAANMLSTAHSREFYKVSHSFHIFRKEFFLQHHQVWTMTKNDPYLVEIPESENFDADTLVQFETAEAVYLHRNRSG
jgi:CMP-N-acetylneuraminic acid synthetase